MSWRDRPTAELLLILLGLTVCFVLVFSGIAIFALVLLNPTYPIGDLTRAYVVAIQNVLFAILGVAAGRSLAPTTDTKP